MINNENSIQLPQKHSKKVLNVDLTGSKNSENGRKSSEVTGAFSEIPVVTRRKAHAFDSENVGGYTFNLECH